VKVLGEMAPAWARVVARHVFGAHAEQAETPRWPAGFECSRAVIYLVRGEPRACAALASAIERQPGRPVGLAENGSQGLE
jgi:hypothetical protein